MMASVRLRAVLFDLDDTLYDYGPCDHSGLDAAWWALRSDIEADLSREQFQQLHNTIHERYATLGNPSSHNRALFFKAMVEAAFGRSRPQLVLELHEAYWRAFYDAMELNGAAIELLLRLQERNLKLGLVSNHVALPQLGKIRQLGLEAYFPVVVTSEEAGADKPDPASFGVALKRLGVPARESVFVGDDEEKDMKGASVAGMTTILTTEYSGRADPSSVADYRVGQLAEVLSVILQISEE